MVAVIVPPGLTAVVPAGRSRREQRGVVGELTACAERVRVRNVFARVGVASTGRR
jgi:hypothetical protein